MRRQSFQNAGFLREKCVGALGPRRQCARREPDTPRAVIRSLCPASGKTTVIPAKAKFHPPSNLELPNPPQESFAWPIYAKVFLKFTGRIHRPSLERCPPIGTH